MKNNLAIGYTLLLAVGNAFAQEAPVVTPIYKGQGIEVNMLSDFEAGVRFHDSGNEEMALTMFRQGAEKKEPKAMFALGSYYYFGDAGVKQDYAEARKLFQAAADKGHPESEYLLSLIYINGEGVPVDKGTAFTHLESAAYKCVPQAQGQLAILYKDGDVVEKDMLQSVAWLSIASETSDSETASTVTQIKSALDSESLKRVVGLEKSLKARMRCPEQ